MKDRILRIYEEQSGVLSLIDWLKLMSWEDSTIVSDVMGQVKHMAKDVRTNPAWIEAHLTKCYAPTSVSKGLLMLEIKIKGGRTIGNLALQTELARDEINGEKITASGTVSFTDLFLQVFNSDSAHAVRNVGLDFDGLCAWLTIYAGGVAQGRQLFDQVLDVVMNNDLDLTAIRFQRGNARRRANSARSGIIKLDMYAERAASEPLGTFSLWTKPMEYGAREYLDPERFNFKATELLKQVAITPTAQQSAQEAAVHTNTTTTVKFIETIQGNRMDWPSFIQWLLAAHGSKAEVLPDSVTTFVDEMGEAGVPPHDLNFSVRRITPERPGDAKAGDTGLVDCVLLQADHTNACGYRVLRFFTLKTCFEHIGQTVLELVKETMLPLARGVIEMKFEEGKRLQLGELGNLLQGHDSMATEAQRAIEQIKRAYQLRHPLYPADYASRLTVELKRLRVVHLSENHRLSEGKILGSVYDHMGEVPGLQFDFTLTTDLSTEAATGNAVEVVNEFSCRALEDATAEAARANSKGKIRMSDPSRTMANSLEGTAMGSMLSTVASVTSQSLPMINKKMPWLQFSAWITCAVQPVIAGHMAEENRNLQRTIVERMHYYIGCTLAGINPDATDARRPGPYDSIVKKGHENVISSSNRFEVETTDEGVGPGMLLLRVRHMLTGYVAGEVKVTVSNWQSIGQTQWQITGLVPEQRLAEEVEVTPAQTPEEAMAEQLKAKPDATIFTTGAFAFFNHALGGLVTLLTEEEQVKARAFVTFVDQMYHLKGVSKESFEVEFVEHERLHILVLEGTDELARLHLKLQ